MKRKPRHDAQRKAVAPVCVLGMHRSGTSLVAGLLRLWGFDLGPGERLMEPKPDNPTGFWEHLGFYTINEQLLSHLGGSWQRPSLVTGSWGSGAELEPFREAARELVLRDFGHGRPWAWKDPRASVLLPFWLQVLPKARYLICIRDPLDVAASLWRRDGMRREDSLRLWTLHIVAALHHTRAQERRLVLPARLLEQNANELQGLRTYLGISARTLARSERRVSRFIDDSRWHHRSPPTPPLGADAAQTQLLYTLALESRDSVGDAERRLELLTEAFWDTLRISDQLEGTRRQLFDVRAKYESRGEELLAAHAARDLNETRALLREREKELAEAMSAPLRNAIEEAQTRALRLEAESTELRSSAEKLAKQLEATRAELEHVRREGTVHRDRSLELQIGIDTARRCAAQKDREIEALRQANEDRSSELGEARAKLWEGQEAIDRLRDAWKALKTESESALGRSEANMEETRALLRDATSRRTRVSGALDERKRENQQLRDELQALRQHHEHDRDTLQRVTSSLGWQVLNRYRETRQHLLRHTPAVERAYVRVRDGFRSRLSRGKAEAATAPSQGLASPSDAAMQPEPVAYTDLDRIASEPIPPPEAWKLDPTRPAVVIVIPHWNRIEYLKGCIASLFEETDYPFFRVCVFDQGSTDGSRAYISSLGERVHAIYSKENLGFVRANNLAVSAFPQWDVVFLNNDTRVTRGWLSVLVSTAYASDRIGLVGAKLLYPDGRLQEAGSQLFRDGSARAYGKFEGQADIRFHQRREVDFCSAACLYVKRRVLDECGVFEECYAPSYYEDADLCMKARAAGFKTVYEPSSVVVHLEYGSSRGSDARARMERNRLEFLRRWHAALATHPASLWSAPSANRDAVLVIGDIVPAPDRSAGGSRLFHILRILATRFDVSYAFLHDQMLGDYLLPLERVGVHPFYPGYARAVGDETLDIAAILSHNSFRYVICSLHTVAAQFMDEIRERSPRSEVMIDTYDVHFVREQREAELLDDPALLERARETRASELSVYQRADAVITVTEADKAALLEHDPDLPVVVVPLIYEVAERIAPRSERRDLLFVGGFSHPPNTDAVLFFCRDILPAVRERLPQLKLNIVGNAPSAEILALKDDEIDVRGYTPNLGRLLDSALISIAPVRFGSGMKGKTTEAMAHGIPVVTTSIGAEGMDLRPGTDVMIADEPREFARCIVELHEDASLWERISRNALEKVRTRWTPEAVGAPLLHLLSVKPRLPSDA